MRERQSLKITEDGITASAEVIDDAGFGRRIAELKESVPADMGPVTDQFLAAMCDGCGTTADLDFNDPQMPGGWTERDDGDYCPDCQ